MTGPALKLDRFLPYRLAVASNAVSTVVSRRYDRLYGLKIPEWRVITLLAEHGPSTQQALVRQGGMDKVTVSRAVQALARRRLITRTPHAYDARSHHVRLTEEGERLYGQVAPEALACEADIFAAFTPREVETLSVLLRKAEQAAAILLEPSGD